MKKINSLQGLIEHEVQDLYSAEVQLVKALPKMSKKAESKELQTALNKHLKQTKDHVDRIKKLAQNLEIKLTKQICKGMEGIVKEGEELVKNTQKGETRDAGIIGASQKVEHYEMATYLSLIRHLRVSEDVKYLPLIERTLVEEMEADEKLQQMAETFIDENALEDV